MSQNRNQSRRNPQRTSYEREGSFARERSRQEYIYGSAVRQAEPVRRRQAAPEERHEPARQRGAEPVRRRQALPVEQMEPVVRKNRDKARYMNAGYLFFLAVAMCAATLILVNYVQLQAELTNRTRSVASKASELNSLRNANDEEYNRIISSINLEEIKRIAIGELGMTYAQEGQIILYTNEDSDYMRPVLGED